MVVAKGKAAWEWEGLVSSRDAQREKTRTSKAQILEGPRHFTLEKLSRQMMLGARTKMQLTKLVLKKMQIESQD